MQKPSFAITAGTTNRFIVPTVLFASLLLRWILVLRGGQYYFSDEGRYETSRAFAESILRGDFTEAFSQFFTAPEHLGFKIIGVIPALVEHFTRESLVIPALFFSLFSVFNLVLIYKISRRIGSSERESQFALILAAASMSLLYYSRHLMPYDPAMTFGLLAIYVALSEKPFTKTSLLCGALGFACFITYNGYWSLTALGLLLYLFRSKTIREFIGKGSLIVLGFFLPSLLLIALAAWRGINLINEYLLFSTTISQGNFDEGWSLPFEYFWHAEHFAILVFSALSIFAITQAIRKKNKSPFLWLGAIAFLYVSLAVPSTYLHSFVVYGRLARQLMPFLVLLSASGLARADELLPRGKTFASTLLVLTVFQAAWNYSSSYRQTYPREFVQQAQALATQFEFSEKRLTFGAPTLCQNNGYVIENVKYFVTPPEKPNPPIQGELLLSASRPDNFLPYQYEGYTYEERERFRELQLQMRFYKADDSFMSDSNPVWAEMKNCVVKE